jgi:hypothetical protein
VPVDNVDGIDKAFMQVVYEFCDAAFERCGDSQVVEDGQMPHTLAQTDATGVQTHRNLELCRHQQHGEALIHSASRQLSI